MSLVVGWFKKFALWSFKVTKQLAVSFTSTLSSIFGSLAYLIPSQCIPFSISLLDFLYAAVTAFCSRRWYSSFSSRTYLMFYQQKSMFFFDERTFLESSCNFVWQSFLTLRNLILFTKSMRSSSNGINGIKEEYHRLLQNAVTATYKKSNKETERRTNCEGINCFVTLKDHKSNFLNNPSTRLINPAKNKIGRISKQILDQMNSKLCEILKGNEWKNTASVIK